MSQLSKCLQSLVEGSLIDSAALQAKEAGIAPALPIATASDLASARWTSTRPDKQVASRLIAMAKRALQTAEVRFRATNGAIAVV